MICPRDLVISQEPHFMLLLPCGLWLQYMNLVELKRSDHSYNSELHEHFPSPCERMQANRAHPILLKHATDILMLGYL